MLVLASVFWAGNFIIGKFAFIESISPFSLVFFRWLTVWFILLPFTYKEILSKKKEILVPLNNDHVNYINLEESRIILNSIYHEI